MQEFDLEIWDKKGAENLAADHLYRLENLHLEQLDNAIDDKYPEEGLYSVQQTTETQTPWFVDIANYLVARTFP